MYNKIINIINSIGSGLLWILDSILITLFAIWNYPPFKASRGYIYSKWISFVVFYFAANYYISLLDTTPFIELYYVAITIFAVALFGPLLRLLLFSEASLYAECGGLVKDLKLKTVTPALKHYWFATAISFIIPILCFATVSK